MKLCHSLVPVALLVASGTLYAAAPKTANAPATASAAASMPKSPVPVFGKADANHDGKITWTEAKAAGATEKIFKQDDFDRNGELNETEWMFLRLDMTDFGPAATSASKPASAPAAATRG